MSAPLPSITTAIALHSHVLPHASAIVIGSYRPERKTGLRHHARRLWQWLMAPIEHEPKPLS